MAYPLRTVIIGSGNVASALAPILERAGVADVKCVYSRTLEHARDLVSQLSNATAISEMSDVPADAELYVVSVKDDAMESLVASLPKNGALWLHTSGGVPAVALSKLSPNYGVLYPLQTFSKGVPVDFSQVPVFIEASNEQSLAVINHVAEAIAKNVYVANGDVRCRLHAAAVFACNFTNHLWAMADDVLRREVSVDIGVLEPLLRETLRKALSVRPRDAQTGPAVRGDNGVMQKHLSLLTDDESKVYKFLSMHIMDYYNISEK